MKKIILLSIPFFLLLSACNNVNDENSNDTETKSENINNDDVTNQVDNEIFGLWTNIEGEIFEVAMKNSKSKPIYTDKECANQVGFAPNKDNDTIKKTANLYSEFTEEEISDGLLENIDNELEISIENENTLIEEPNFVDSEANWELTEENQLLMTHPESSGDKESYCLYEKTTEFE